MKKAKMIFTFIVVFVAFIPSVFATNYMSVSKNNVKVGESFDVAFTAENIQGCDIEITPTANASECTTRLNIPVDGGSGDGRTSVTCTVDEAGTVTFTLTGSIKTIGTDENPDGETIELNETLEVVVTEEVKPKGLASLSVTGGTLLPTFDSDKTTGYIITLNSSETTSFSINAVAKTTTDKITAKRENGENYEPIELNNITFVTAGNNSTMLIEINVGEGERLTKYEIQVVKPTKINPPELTTLTVDGNNIPLVSDRYEYEITLEEKESYTINATLKDSTNYKFEFLTPPFETSSKDIGFSVVPKDPSSGLSSANYHIIIKTNTIEPVTVPKTTTQSHSGGDVENPQTGSTPAYIVAIILVSSLIVSMYLYKKNINGYN